MRHFGDITKIHGDAIPIVDCITGGSPCQDLSIAGRRLGLDGERSGLFFEQIRIVKEMREHDRQTNQHRGISIRPRFLVWENVTGALSSNNGEDFRIVLEEIAKVADENAVIPRYEGKWRRSGCIMGRGWSIAWRVHNAQFWGSAQRRERLSVVADFGSQSAPEVLFERTSMSRDFGQIEEEGERTAANIRKSSCQSDSNDVQVFRKQGHPMNKEMAQGREKTETADTLNTSDNTDAKSPILVVGKAWNGQDVMPTLTANSNNQLMPDKGNFGAVITYGETISFQERCGKPGGGKGILIQKERTGTLSTLNNQMVVDRSQQLICLSSTSTNATHLENISPTIISRAGTGGGNTPILANCGTVRRLTPLECERLQGFPDGWTNIGDWIDSKGKKHKGNADSPRYKALGNSICTYFWFWLCRRISAQYIGTATLGSLFDGIGGFPYVWERCNGKGSAIWASEIEEFPIAVTKYHFPEDEERGESNETD